MVSHKWAVIGLESRAVSVRVKHFVTIFCRTSNITVLIN